MQTIGKSIPQRPGRITHQPSLHSSLFGGRGGGEEREREKRERVMQTRYAGKVKAGTIDYFTLLQMLRTGRLKRIRKLSDEETEAIRFSPPSFALAHFRSDSIPCGSCKLKFTQRVGYLELWPQSDLTMSLKFVSRLILKLNGSVLSVNTLQK